VPLGFLWIIKNASKWSKNFDERRIAGGADFSHATNVM